MDIMHTNGHTRWKVVLIVTLLLTATGYADGEEEMLQAGQPFVTFELEAHDGSTVNTADLAGRPFLLFFYPKADTPG